MNGINSIFIMCLLAGSFSANAQSLSSAQRDSLLKAPQGTIVHLDGLLSTGIKKVPYQKLVMPGPQFLISDDPEYIRIPEAIVMQEDVVPGAVRLYVYNVNGVVEPEMIDRKITTVIKNTGTEEMSIRMLRYSSQKPSKNYFHIGKQGLADYFASEMSSEIRKVAPGDVLPIDEALENHIVKYDELVHGFYEFVIDQPGQISVLQTGTDVNSKVALERIDSVVPNSHVNAGRGIFGVSNYKITNEEAIDTKNGVVQLVVADGEDDPWIQGTVGTDQEAARNAGNYGVMYEVNLKWKSSDGKGLALVTWNSRSADNKWCGGMATTMVLHNGKLANGITQLPADRLVTKAAPEAILVQIFEPVPGQEEQEIKFTYSPPGASCLPTPLVFIPIDLK